MDVAMKFDKRLFFDRKLVASMIGKKFAAVLGQSAAFVRRRARSSLRRRKKTSSAGSPPSVHTKDNVATLKNIQFQFDNKRTSVFVGALKLNQVVSAAVPGLHEHGGTATNTQWRIKPQEFYKRGLHKRWGKFKNEWRTITPRSAARKQARMADLVETRTASATYAPRPFMGPALAAELPKFASLFARSA